jgi:hypothetical protein
MKIIMQDTFFFRTMNYESFWNNQVNLYISSLGSKLKLIQNIATYWVFLGNMTYAPCSISIVT